MKDSLNGSAWLGLLRAFCFVVGAVAGVGTLAIVWQAGRRELEHERAIAALQSEVKQQRADIEALRPTATDFNRLHAAPLDTDDDYEGPRAFRLEIARAVYDSATQAVDSTIRVRRVKGGPNNVVCIALFDKSTNRLLWNYPATKIGSGEALQHTGRTEDLAPGLHELRLIITESFNHVETWQGRDPQFGSAPERPAVGAWHDFQIKVPQPNEALARQGR